MHIATNTFVREHIKKHAGMLGRAVGIQIVLPTICYVRLVGGLHVQARKPHELDDKSGFGRNTCPCARFLLMLLPFFLSRIPEKGQQTPYQKKQTFLHIST